MVLILVLGGGGSAKREVARIPVLPGSGMGGCEPTTKPLVAPLALPSEEDEEAAAARGLVVGIDGGYEGWSACETSQRRQLSAAITRHQWNEEEPVDIQDDVVLAAAEKVHTRIEALIGADAIHHPRAYARFVVELIERYGEGGSFWKEHPGLDERRYAIHTFELGNEPYFGGQSPEEYAAAVRPTLEAVKEAGLPAQLILPSRIYGEEAEWMETYYQVIPDLNSLFAGFADHPYDYGQSPAAPPPAGPFGRIATLREKMDQMGSASKSIFITEYGESTADCGEECASEADQAKHIREMTEAVVDHPSWKIAMLVIYQLIDRGEESTDPQLQFGLLQQDGRPKPAWALVHEAAVRYRGDG